ncbi:hypothetical protein CEXT_558731 [Caerostris extrusa]|uniref:Uncharacterized protein n=1 Tax=Caerostris extrusa TaxID=172846 RepID=A0AAV4RMB8_CAEEX|nr:hypothetical protein CEXT_558731 [Caerostris extrusa]
MRKSRLRSFVPSYITSELQEVIVQKDEQAFCCRCVRRLRVGMRVMRHKFWVWHFHPFKHQEYAKCWMTDKQEGSGLENDLCLLT